jgi:LmbE family N-acetylglucosaminyl deacetylase
MLISEQAHASGTPSASPAPQPDAAQIQLALRKLGVVGSVLYVAAHPDDENTNLLAYLSKELLLRTGYLSLTRGDGGQNLIGAEQGADLGVIRTQELLAARRIDGAEQFFTRARDFGYSKSAEETLKIWGKDAILADMVWVIRRFRPDVIVTRFSPEVTDTHGHHTASAQLAVEAFHAAADAKFHPEQLSEEVRPWQARRLFWNRSSWSIKDGEDLSAFIKMDVNSYNPLLGISVGELSADSRSMHKSQGFGVARSRLPITEYFAPLDSGTASGNSFLSGLDFSWKRFRGTAALARLIEQAQRQFVPATPHTSIRALLAIDEVLDHLGEVDWRARKKAEVRELVLACAGVFAEATASDFRVVPGGDLALTASAVNRSPAKIVLSELKVAGASFTDAASAKDSDKSTSLRVNQPLGSVEIKKTLRSHPNVPESTPYWLALAPEPGLFRVAKADEIGLPEAPASLFVDFVLTVDQHTLQVRRPIVYKWTDPVAGERYRSVEVVPSVSVKPATKVLMLPRGEARSVTVRLAAATLPVAGVLRLEAPPGWAVTPATIPFAFDKTPTLDLSFRVQPPTSSPGQSQSAVEARLRAVADVDPIHGNHLAQGVEHIEHPHIPIQAVLVPSEIHAVALPVEIQGKTIACIPGPGDEVPSMLQQIGYDVTVLPDELLPHLTAAALARFDAVVIGVRAYNSNDKLPSAQPALMAYVHQGGTVVAQYNTNNRLAPLTLPIGPYPFTIGRERVTDENAPVEFLAPEQQLLNWPNKITSADFEGWVQERGLYFASTWDTHYQTVLSMRDLGEPALAGGLLVAHEGKGIYIYTGLSFFRQLPAGVPGAFRLFANLLAAGQKVHAR